MYLMIYLFIYLFVYLSIYLLIYLTPHLFSTLRGLGNVNSRHYLLRDEISFRPDRYYASIGLGMSMN